MKEATRGPTYKRLCCLRYIRVQYAACMGPPGRVGKAVKRWVPSCVQGDALARLPGSPVGGMSYVMPPTGVEYCHVK